MIPLYGGHAVPQSWNMPLTAHAGLWFERFFDRYEGDWTVDSPRNDFLCSLIGQRSAQAGTQAGQGRVGSERELHRQADAMAELTEQLSGRCFLLESTWHFATGLGSPHPMENSLLWHPILGTPYLPGSAVKGLARAWLELHDYDPAVRKRLFGSDDKDPRRATGDDSSPPLIAGEVIFFDALPVEPVSLAIDTMTPHMGKWYEKGAARPGKPETTPGDWHAPNPIIFLAARRIILQFAVAPRTSAARPLVPLAVDALKAALEHLGAGAKTAVGYGSFTEPRSVLARRVAEQRQQAREARRSARAFEQLSPNRKTIEGFRRQSQIPANRKASSGAEFQRSLVECLRQAVEWPASEREELAEFAADFFRNFGSAKKKKEVKPLIRALREA
ncbi:MAG: type III-B CRISPR module RAMP protein Cmr6 [Gammaproteobacteria bacterium]|nr:MAG: type III-B CRISPR module RAMP protein Cmr6 [Gammaproteobacteria bacterium]